MAVACACYQLVYFFLAHNGGRPTVFKPWFAIPAEEYYRWNAWMVVPSILLAWVAAAGFTQLAATEPDAAAREAPAPERAP